MQIDKSKPVMVSGATGYVAGHLVKKLLEEGLTVHAAVRNPDNKEKLKYLDQLAKSTNGSIKYFKADLLDEGSYDEATKGCELVFHTASPFTSKINDAQKDLIDPALKGTQNVLGSVNRIETVKRVVLTSSCAAIFGDAKDLQELPNQTITEEHWNTSSSLTHQPYSYSKTVAEKEAWKIAQKQDRWDLVTINPSLVLGPGINPNGTSESFNIIKMMADGRMKSGVPDMKIGIVDVRDVAEAHYRAGFTPEAKGRYITSAEDSGLYEISQILREKYGDKYPFPKSKAPKFLIWLLAPTQGFTRKWAARSIGYPWKADNSKIKNELGIKFRQGKESIIDFFQQMIDNGSFTKN